MSASAPLLATKLYVPRSRPQSVARPRLLGRLDAAREQPLVLVSAPAGFGKTTLVSEWIARTEGRVAWLSLDDGDNDPARFWTYVIAALRTIRVDVGEIALSLLNAQASPPSPEPVLTALLNDVATLPERFSLILDDYHVITTPAIHEWVGFLVEHVPPQMQIVITSRADPPLPLARLRVRAQLGEIRAADLRFTSEEVAAFLNHVMELGLSHADIAALEARTEGWIAGLQLAALSMRGCDDLPGFIQSFAGSHVYIIDYLVEEVLRRQPPEVETFLLQTSLLNRLSGALCDAMAG